MKQILILFFYLLCSTHLFATGNIGGKIIDQKSQKPLVGVNVIIENMTNVINLVYSKCI